MSLTSTTTRDRFANSLKSVAGLAAGLAIAVWIGFAIPGAETPDTVGTTSSNSLTHEEFVRLNTTDLPALPVGSAVEPAPSSSASPDTVVTAVGWANRDAYFLHINTGALDGIATTPTEPPHRPSGPR